MSSSSRVKAATAWSAPTRRQWLLLAASSGLTACGGGGGGGGLAGVPGTGGTGLYAQGSIAGFGSVIVNNIKFDDTAAVVQLNGLAALPADLRLGMVANVQGTRSAVAGLGVATAIEVWSVAQGPITAIQTGQFSVMGMQVQTDAATVLEGLASAAALAVGMRVTVWGLQAGADGSQWAATRVALAPAAGASVTTGYVTVSSSQRSVNGLSLSGNGVSALTAGQWVRVQGSLQSSGRSMQVDSIKLLGAASAVLPQGEAELEGLVTAVLSSSRFLLGNVEVDATAAIVSPAGAKISVGLRLEVEGTWVAGVLKAAKIGVKSEQSSQEVEIEARIEQFTSLANFVVRGQRCDGSALKSIDNGKVSDLKVGVKVKVKGRTMGDVLLLSSLEIED